MDKERKTIKSISIDEKGDVSVEMMPKREPPEHILQFFSYKHLPEHLAKVSEPFGLLADQIVRDLPRNPERTVALRKLLEAKDAAVRAMVAK